MIKSERDIEYEKNNIAIYYYHDTEEYGGGIKCKNYELCETVLHKDWFNWFGRYLCHGCHLLFGTWKFQGAEYKTGKGILKISDNLECPICLEKTRSISQPNCEHTVCIKCFKRCYYGDSDTENEPKFPYPDIKDEYDEDPDNQKWDIDYPLIKIYNQEWNKWEDENEEKYENEENLRKCPLCRK